MLETSIFCIAHNVFYPSQANFNFSAEFNLLSANAFNLYQSKHLSFWKGFSSEINPFPNKPWVFFTCQWYKHCGKRRNCSLRAISPFPTLFSTCLENFLPFSSNLKLLSADSFRVEGSKICRFG